MTKLRGATISEFLKTVEIMRTVYPFKDDKAKIVNTYDFPSESHTTLELYIKDENTGTHITLSRGIEQEEAQERF